MELYKGMKVVCIDNEVGGETISLIKGKEYIVEKWTENAIKVKGHSGYYLIDRFKTSINNPIKNTDEIEKELSEKMQKLTERKFTLEAMEEIEREKMNKIADERFSVVNELKSVTAQYSEIIKNKVEAKL